MEITIIGGGDIDWPGPTQHTSFRRAEETLDLNQKLIELGGGSDQSHFGYLKYLHLLSKLVHRKIQSQRHLKNTIIMTT